MNRRYFIKTAGLLTASAMAGPRFAFAAPPEFNPSPA